MVSYEQKIMVELRKWQRKVQAKPSWLNRFSKRTQNKINSYIPEKIHNGITAAIREMVKGVLFGSRITTSVPSKVVSLETTEKVIVEKIIFYKKTAAAEGGITGAGGFFLALADFPIFLGIKMKMLFEIAAQYGYDIGDYRERIYLLHIFQLAFSSQENRTNVYQKMVDWEKKKESMPGDINEFDWRNFQQEYRDYLDLVKLAQMIPVIGAAVGLVVNYRMTQKLGTTAMNAYRMRLVDEGFITTNTSSGYSKPF